MSFRDIACPTLDLTRLSRRSRTFRSEFAQKLQTPLGQSFVSRSLARSHEISRSTVFEMARGSVPSGTPSMAMLKLSQLVARRGNFSHELENCPCVPARPQFFRSDLRLVPRRLNNFLNLLQCSTSTCICRKASDSQNDALRPLSLFLPFFLLVQIIADSINLQTSRRKSMSSLDCYSCLFYFERK